jgi:hypothetical protein
VKPWNIVTIDDSIDFATDSPAGIDYLSVPNPKPGWQVRFQELANKQFSVITLAL